MLSEFKERIEYVKNKPSMALDRFKVGDIVYPVYHRHLNNWGEVVNIDETIRMIDVDFNGCIRRFQPEWLIHVNPEFTKNAKKKVASVKPRFALYYKEKPALYKQSLSEEEEGLFRCPKCKENMKTVFDVRNRITQLVCDNCGRKINVNNLVASVVLDKKIYGAMTKKTVARYLYKLIERKLRGVFNDNYWKPIHDAFDIIRDTGVDLEVEVKNGGYSLDGTSKRWDITVEWENFEEKKFVLHGIVVASGAGSVDDPLSVYDVTFYFTNA